MRLLKSKAKLSLIALNILTRSTHCKYKYLHSTNISTEKKEEKYITEQNIELSKEE